MAKALRDSSPPPGTPNWPRPLVEFDVPLYGGRVYLFDDAGKYDQAWHYLTHAPNAKPCGRGQAAHMERNGESAYLVGVTDGRMSTLVHELTHIAFYIAGHVGLEVDPAKANESFCYLLDNLVQLAIDGCGKRK